jgi:hypothetical protein
VINVSHVGDLDKPRAVEKRTDGRRIGAQPILLQIMGDRLRYVMESHGLEAFAVAHEQRAVSGAAKIVCLLKYGLEHRREIAGRGIDDLQHLGGRGLPLQRLVAFGSTLGKLTLQIGYEQLGVG